MAVSLLAWLPPAPPRSISPFPSPPHFSFPTIFSLLCVCVCANIATINNDKVLHGERRSQARAIEVVDRAASEGGGEGEKNSARHDGTCRHVKTPPLKIGARVSWHIFFSVLSQRLG